MPNFSLRDLDTATLARIKSTARRQKLSVNRLIVETLRQHYAPGNRAPDELDALAGTWSEAEADEFNAAIAPFGEIDRALWVAEPRAIYRVTPAAHPARAPAPMPAACTAAKSARKRAAK